MSLGKFEALSRSPRCVHDPTLQGGCPRAYSIAFKVEMYTYWLCNRPESFESQGHLWYILGPQVTPDIDGVLNPDGVTFGPSLSARAEFSLTWESRVDRVGLVPKIIHAYPTNSTKCHCGCLMGHGADLTVSCPRIGKLR